jgi:hypothetical protein
MYATLEENTDVKLRADTIPLSEGAKVRIVAYKASDSTLDQEKLYTHTSGKLVPDDGIDLELEAGSYGIVAYSYNSAAALPSHSSMSAVDPKDDLLCAIKIVEITPTGNNAVSLVLKHHFSQLKLEVTTNYNGSFDLGKFGNITVSPNRKLDLTSANPAEVSGTPGNAQAIFFSQWEGNPAGLQNIPALNSTATSSDYATVWTNGNDYTDITFSTFKIDNDEFKHDGLHSRFDIRFNKKLLSGHSYTLKVRFKKIEVARSNIYWDDVNKRLTFETSGSEDKSKDKYQGGMFKWGSLVGISPNDAGTVYTYTPVYINNSGHQRWDKTPVSDLSSLTTISVHTYSLAPDEVFNKDVLVLSNLGNSKFQDKIGDICRYLGEVDPGLKGYRMFSQREFTNVTASWVTPTPWPAVSGTSADGTSEINGGVFGQSNRFLPASGQRSVPDNYGLREVGRSGFYWSSIAAWVSTGGSFYFTSLGSGSQGGFMQGDLGDAENSHSPMPVRCVRDD